MNYLEDVGEDLAVTNETKKCPYCGGEIKAVALKCKHCGKFLEEVKSGDIIYQEPLKNNKGRNIGIGCAWFLGIFIILGIIGSFLPETETYNNTDNISSDYNTEQAQEVKERVTGTYSGFGAMDVAFSNLGGQNAGCAQSGAGKSLVNEIEKKFAESSPNKDQVLYSISSYNPRLKLNVSNHRWAENVYNPDLCIADISFKNYKPDTIAGYSGYGENAEPYTIDEAQFRVSYYVSELSGKYKARISSIRSDVTKGYYE